MLQQQKLKQSQLMEQKKNLEIEIQQLQENLNQKGVGLNGNLVDKEGFPIGDVSTILYARECRNKLARLQTDYRLVMEEIENFLVVIHSQAEKNSSTISSPRTCSTLSNMKQEQIQSTTGINPTLKNSPILEAKNLSAPFARVDEVAIGSPAEQAHLCVDDLIISFGSITALDNNRLKLIGGESFKSFVRFYFLFSKRFVFSFVELVQSSEGITLTVIVQRKDSTKQESSINYLELVPRKWNGRGLLG